MTFKRKIAQIIRTLIEENAPTKQLRKTSNVGTVKNEALNVICTVENKLDRQFNQQTVRRPGK